jgi:hypothetical protein
MRRWLYGSSEQYYGSDPKRVLLEPGFGGKRGPCRANCDEVMAASMTDFRQRIVFLQSKYETGDVLRR